MKFTPFYTITSLCLVSILFTGCGKNETAGSALGAAGGGLIGTAVAGKKDKTAGLLIGGLLGSIVGREMGKSADEEEEFETKMKDHEQACRRREIDELQEENERLRQNLITWCSNCGRRSEILGAHSCPSCGANLIREKVCKNCSTVFSPQAGYKYCPYCKDRVLLVGR